MRLVQSFVPVMVLCGVLGGFPAARAAVASDWPEWRGPHRDGVADAGAPPSWTGREDLVWQTPLPGSGRSTPVVAGSRVFVTAAESHERETLAHQLLRGVVGLLASGGLPLLAWRRLRDAGGPGLGTRRGLAVCDGLVGLASGLTVGGFALAFAIGPASIDALLHAVRDAGVFLAREAGRPRTNLSFVTWSDAAPHLRWIIGSACALLALGLVPFSRPARLFPRLAGALAVLIGLLVTVGHVPWPESYGTRVPFGPIVVCFGPVGALAAWHVVVGLAAAAIPRGASVASGVELPPRGVRAARVAGLLVPVVLATAIGVAAPLWPERETVVHRRLLCLDLESGALLWSAVVFATPPEAASPLNSYATPSPAVSGETVVVAFGAGVAAYSVEGAALWSKRIPGWIEGSIYGAGSSPVIHDDRVFVVSDREYHSRRDSLVAAYALRTGDELWRQTPEFAHDGYATPALYTDGGRTLLLAPTARALAAYDAATGALVWQIATPILTPIPSPVISGDRLYLTGGLNGDGHTASYQLRSGAPPEILWASRRNPADVASPVVAGGRLFTITSTGIMVAYDAESGDIQWRTRVGRGLGSFYASLVASGERVYATRSNGTTYVIANESEYRLVGEGTLADDLFASPVLTDGCVLLRTTTALHCVRSAPVRRDTEHRAPAGVLDNGD